MFEFFRLVTKVGTRRGQVNGAIDFGDVPARYGAAGNAVLLKLTP
jgi:hypothetical protein